MEPNTVYFVAFSDGIVKVGRTSNFRQRLATLRHQAKQRGAVDTQSWAMSHASARIAEHILLRVARGLFDQPFGAEFFTAEFDPFVAAMARSLDERGADAPIVTAMRDSLRELQAPGTHRRARAA